MRPPRSLVPLVVLAALASAMGLAACGSSAGDATAGGGDATTSAPTTPATPASGAGQTGLRGVRYCEVLLLSHDDAGYTAEVWNTMGLSDCPQDQWDALDAAAIAKDRGVLAALLNGPRYWTLDSIATDLRKGAPETTFGGIGMFRAATVDLGDQPPDQTPYTERRVARDTVFGFDAGSEVYELVAPDGTTYIMQARSQIVDPTLDESDLPTLGDRLDLPDGWEYRVRTLDEPLGLLSVDGVAVVIQDELQDTYQRIDAVA